jgi:hypothetical protein
MLCSAGERFELTFAPALYGYADVDQSAPSDEDATVAAANQEAPPVVCLDVTVDAVALPAGEDDAAALTSERRLVRAAKAKERGVQLYARGRCGGYTRSGCLMLDDKIAENFNPET